MRMGIISRSVSPADLNCLGELVEQTYIGLAKRGCARQFIRAAWIEWWLTQGKTPSEVVNIALGRPAAGD